MFAVIFEVTPDTEGKQQYLQLASRLREFLAEQEGFISIERFQSLADENKLLSLSFWQDEGAIAAWRNKLEHRAAQKAGRDGLFQSYRIRVAEVVRDYSQGEREQAPPDSRQVSEPE